MQFAFQYLFQTKCFLLEAKGAIKIDAPISTGMILIGYGNIGIFDKKRSRSIWQVYGNVIFNGKANIGHGCKISVGKDAEISFGDGFTVSAETQIISHKKIKFGKNVLISWDCLFIDTDFHKIFDKSGRRINSPKPIIIGDKVWIGCRNVILKGSKVSDGSIIAANSFLNKDISEQSGIFIGNPIQFVKGQIYWEH